MLEKQNNKIIAFHKRFGAIITDEDEENYYLNLLCKSIMK